MPQILILRHGPTAWNAAGLLQGRTDTPLSAAGRRRVAAWRIPPAWQGASCLTSPLQRARETAAILGYAGARIEPRLTEMAWGAFEGRRLAELRSQLGPAMAELEARGLDFMPPNGESPRMVIARLATLFDDLAADGGDAVLVTHKGVQRAALALATGWAMTAKPPVRIGPDEALLVDLDADGAHAARALTLAAG